MKIGIIGTGNIGSNLAKLFVKAGHDVVLSWSRTPEKLVQLSIELGNGSRAKAVSVLEATQDVDLSVLSIRFSIMDSIIKQMGDVKGKVIVDTNNQYDIKLPDGMSGAAEVQKRLPGIRLVKSFNSIFYQSLLTHSFSKPATVMPLCSDDEEAKKLVSTLILDSGFIPFDVGGLNQVKLQEIDGPYYNKILTLSQAEIIRGSLL